MAIELLAPAAAELSVEDVRLEHAHQTAAAGAKPGEWILGRGWHQDKWDRVPEPNVNGLPVHDALSRVTPQNPVLLTHASGHMAIVNARAMELAGITAESPDPEGGQILRDAAGLPTGVLLETAADAVSALAEREPSPDELRRMAELAAAECLANGITSFQDGGASFAEVEVLRGLAEAGELPVRLWVMLSEGNEALTERLPGYHVKDAGGGGRSAMAGAGDERGACARRLRSRVDG